MYWGSGFKAIVSPVATCFCLQGSMSSDDPLASNLKRFSNRPVPVTWMIVSTVLIASH